MDIIADILLAAGALGAGIYCYILGRRLNRFNDLEKGVGGAVAVLSAQVDDLTMDGSLPLLQDDGLLLVPQRHSLGVCTSTRRHHERILPYPIRHGLIERLPILRLF